MTRRLPYPIFDIDNHGTMPFRPAVLRKVIKLCIKTPTGDTITLEVEPGIAIDDLKNIILEKAA